MADGLPARWINGMMTVQFMTPSVDIAEIKARLAGQAEALVVESERLWALRERLRTLEVRRASSAPRENGNVKP